ncbi:MAG: 4-(cytidine 5'-diphospho)-2-C-methyl-D-erythritol kinase [Thermoleophilia bacterium]
MSVAARPKLNLRLVVGARRADGYHPLRSLMVELHGLEDTVTVAPAGARSLDCPGFEGTGNLAWRALDELEAEVGRPLPVAVSIVKRIPAQAGLGGGSSDAAATLVATDRALGLGLGHERLEAVAARVGSDAPFFVRGGAQWARGRGELLSPATVPPFAAVLVKPQVGLSTAAVYGEFDRLPPPPPDDGSEAPGEVEAMLPWLRNDLWPPARALAPGLDAAAGALRAAGARAVLLCGSGSCLAGIVRDRAEGEAVAARLPAAIGVVTGG